MSSFDVDLARRLSTRLTASRSAQQQRPTLVPVRRPVPAPVAPTRSTPPSVTTSTHTAPVSKPIAAIQTSTPVSTLPPPPSNETKPLAPPKQLFATWDDVLVWFQAGIGAEASFVVDSQGFVIATRGHAPNEGFDGMGAELCFSVEQLHRVDPLAGELTWVELEFARRRIVVLRVQASPESEAMIIGALAPDPNYQRHRQELESTIAASLQTLP